MTASAGDGPVVAAVVLTHNERHRLPACLGSLAWADRVLVIDSLSDDDTVPAAREHGAEVLSRAFTNFADQRNFALNAVDAEWILFVDADERVSEELILEIRRRAGREAFVAYAIPRRNHLLGATMRATGWYPDFQTRLLRRGSCRYALDRPVHETVETDGPLGTLRSEILHAGPATVAAFRARQRRYLSLAAEGLRSRGSRAGFHSPVVQALREFWRRIVQLRGYRDGWRGLVLSILMAEHEFRVYRELRNRPSR